MRSVWSQLSDGQPTSSGPASGLPFDSAIILAQEQSGGRLVSRQRSAGWYSSVALSLMSVLLTAFIIWDALSASNGHGDFIANRSNAEVPQLPTGAIRGISISPDGRFLDVMQGATTLIRRDPESGDQLSRARISPALLIRMQILSDELGWVAINSHNEVEFIRGDSCFWRGTLPEQCEDDTLIECARIAATNRIVVASKLGSLWLLEVDATGLNLLSQCSVGIPLADMKASPTDERLVLITASREVLIWDVYLERHVQTIRTGAQDIRFAKWSGNGQRLVTFGVGGTLKVWDVAAGTLIRELMIDAQMTLAADFSFDGTQLASGNGSQIIVWNLSDGEETHVLAGHPATICSLAFTDEGSTLFSGDLEGGLRRWSLKDDREVWSIP